MAVEIDFPADLPCVSRIDGYAMQASAAVIRTPIGSGKSVQRRAHMQMPMQMQLAWRVNNEQLDPLFQWLNQYGYDWFNIDMSGLESSKLDTFKSPMAIRLITNLNIALIKIHRQNWYILSTTAEYEPPLSVRVYEIPLFFAVNPATHAHTADNVTLMLAIQTLNIHQATHTLTSDNMTLAQLAEFVVADATHGHVADNVLLGFETDLVVQDATHAHAADNLTLSLGLPLPIDDATHAHAADNITLSL